MLIVFEEKPTKSTVITNVLSCSLFAICCLDLQNINKQNCTGKPSCIIETMVLTCGGDDELDFLMFIVCVMLSIKGKVRYVIDNKFYETGAWIGKRNC